MRSLTAPATFALAIVLCSAAAPAVQSDGWIPLFDGRSLSGWKAAENPSTFRVENGEIVVRGPRAHLFYDGPVMNHEFTDFELRLEYKMPKMGNSGVGLRTPAPGKQPQGYGWDPAYNPANNKPASATMSIDEYLAGLSAEHRAALQKIRKAVHVAAPKAEE